MGYWIARIWLRLIGWHAEGQPPHEPKAVMIAAPHTANTDVLLMVLFALYYRLRLRFLLKHTLFRWPFGWFFRAIGGIPTDRRAANGMVAQSIERVKADEVILLGMSPEGTRSAVNRWKTGFYHIAVGAGVPIALGFLDYRRKVGGFGPTFYPTGELAADMVHIQNFYRTITGKRPDQFGGILLEEGS